jgi:hypothetical protein
LLQLLIQPGNLVAIDLGEIGVEPDSLRRRRSDGIRKLHLEQTPLRYRDSRYGALFSRRLPRLGISRIRAPFGTPQANSIAERWVRSVRRWCLDHTFGERHLRRWANALLARRSRGRRAVRTAKWSQRQSWTGCITSTKQLHDPPDFDFAPYRQILPPRPDTRPSEGRLLTAGQDR